MITLTVKKSSKATPTDIINALKRGQLKGIDLVGREFRDALKQSLIQGTRRGKKYPGLPNRSSAPGEVPKSQSGRLANGVRYEGSGDGIEVTNVVEYSAYLEQGTRNMKFRPHMAGLFRERDDEFLDIMEQTPLKEIKKLK